MGKSERKRQKALLKKREKDNLRRKKAKESSPHLGSLFSVESRIYNARRHPIYECLIGSSWAELGLTQILLPRKQADGNIVFGAYLVDVYCLGLKNTFCDANLSLSEYENELKARVSKKDELIDCSVDFAHQLIYGAIDYASKLGFKPHKDFKLSKYVLEERADIKESSEIEFGKDGKPFFVAGPDDDVEQVIRKLEAAVGSGNFHYFYPVGGDEEIFLEVEEEEEWEEKSEVSEDGSKSLVSKGRDFIGHRLPFPNMRSKKNK